MEIKLKIPTEGLGLFTGQDVLAQLIEQCGEYERKTDNPYLYVVLGEKYNVVVEGYKSQYITLQIKPEGTL